PKYKFESVAVVRSNHTGGLSGLRGKNLCHPGFHRTQYWSDRVLKRISIRALTYKSSIVEPGMSSSSTEIISPIMMVRVPSQHLKEGIFAQ
ncbi:unnamed protein product, partial [Timema podura]|nr:unnamed protein product [Timema podura]